MLERHANQHLAHSALADPAIWTDLVAAAADGDEVALATISSTCTRLIYTMNRGRSRHVDDHEGDVLEALWAAVCDLPASRDDLIRSARRTMERAATSSKRATRTLSFDEIPTNSATGTARSDSDMDDQVCTRMRLREIAAELDTPTLHTFAARAGLIPHSAVTKSASARSRVRNARHRLAAA